MEKVGHLPDMPTAFAISRQTAALRSASLYSVSRGSYRHEWLRTWRMMSSSGNNELVDAIFRINNWLVRRRLRVACDSSTRLWRSGRPAATHPPPGLGAVVARATQRSAAATQGGHSVWPCDVTATRRHIRTPPPHLLPTAIESHRQFFLIVSIDRVNSSLIGLGKLITCRFGFNAAFVIEHRFSTEIWMRYCFPNCSFRVIQPRNRYQQKNLREMKDFMAKCISVGL